MLSKLKNRFNQLSPFTQGSIILILLLIIGIILRWDIIMEGVNKGFKFFSK